MAPKMLIKSVKLGIKVLRAVMTAIIKVLLIIFLNLIRAALPIIKNFYLSTVPKQASICNGYEHRAFKHTQILIKMVNPLIGKFKVKIVLQSLLKA